MRYCLPSLPLPLAWPDQSPELRSVNLSHGPLPQVLVGFTNCPALTNALAQRSSPAQIGCTNNKDQPRAPQRKPEPWVPSPLPDRVPVVRTWLSGLSGGRPSGWEVGKTYRQTVERKGDSNTPLGQSGRGEKNLCRLLKGHSQTVIRNIFYNTCCHVHCTYQYGWRAVSFRTSPIAISRH